MDRANQHLTRGSHSEGDVRVACHANCLCISGRVGGPPGIVPRARASRRRGHDRRHPRTVSSLKRWTGADHGIHVGRSRNSSSSGSRSLVKVVEPLISANKTVISCARLHRPRVSQMRRPYAAEDEPCCQASLASIPFPPEIPPTGRARTSPACRRTVRKRRACRSRRTADRSISAIAQCRFARFEAPQVRSVHGTRKAELDDESHAKQPYQA